MFKWNVECSVYFENKSKKKTNSFWDDFFSLLMNWMMIGWGQLWFETSSHLKVIKSQIKNWWLSTVSNKVAKKRVPQNESKENEKKTILKKL